MYFPNTELCLKIFWQMCVSASTSMKLSREFLDHVKYEHNAAKILTYLPSVKSPLCKSSGRWPLLFARGWMLMMLYVLDRHDVDICLALTSTLHNSKKQHTGQLQNYIIWIAYCFYGLQPWVAQSQGTTLLFWAWQIHWSKVQTHK